jgi:redox-sensitive bicupin YhaK (pirin superfamily)
MYTNFLIGLLTPLLMKTTYHPAESRGHANHGWLKTYHSFSFASWYNPQRMHFGLLRVLNDDIIAGGTGFGTHPHNDMEIISIPIKGALAHKDSHGNEGIVRDKDVQVMSAGYGVEHSEYNGSKTEEAQFLQIWIFPNRKEVEPRHAMQSYDPATRSGQWQLQVGPMGSGVLEIHQDAFISRASIKAGQTLPYQWHKPGNGVYLFLIEGSLKVGDHTLKRRDALGIEDVVVADVEALADADVLVLEVPMR